MEIVTLRVGVRAKEGVGGGGGEKKKRAFVFSFPAPSPRAPFDSPHFLLSLEFQHGAFEPDENACTASYKKVKLSFSLVRNQLKPWRRSLEQYWEAISFSN